jgi:hypothetical protein
MSLDHHFAALVDGTPPEDKDRPISETVTRIVMLNCGLRDFWSASYGWAPKDAADLMSKSRLDRQAALSRSLRHWLVDPPDGLEDGDLILGWTNLGSLIEGTIKLFLAVYYQDYKNDLENLKKTKAWHEKKLKLLDPDELRLDVLIDYVEKANLFPKDELALFKFVQNRRNAIHAFKDRPIGSGSELHAAIKGYIGMLRSTNCRLPYPDDFHQPGEI